MMAYHIESSAPVLHRNVVEAGAGVLMLLTFLDTIRTLCRPFATRLTTLLVRAVNVFSHVIYPL